MSRSGKPHFWVWKRWFGRRNGSLGNQWTELHCWYGKKRIDWMGKTGYGIVPVAVTRLDGSSVVLWSVGEMKKGRRMKKKKEPGTNIALRHLAAMETEYLKDLMPIVEHLAVTQYEDGDARKTGSITIETYGSVWQIRVKDHDSLQEMKVQAKTLDEALLNLAIYMSSEDAPWMPDEWARREAEKKKKK